MKFEILDQESDSVKMSCRIDDDGDFLIEVHHPDLESGKSVLAFICKDRGALIPCKKMDASVAVLKKLGFSVENGKIKVM